MKDPWNAVRAFSCLAALLLTSASTSAPPGSRTNHLFQKADSAADAYDALSPELAPELLDLVAEWLEEHVQ